MNNNIIPTGYMCLIGKYCATRINALMAIILANYKFFQINISVSLQTSF